MDAVLLGNNVNYEPSPSNTLVVKLDPTTKYNGGVEIDNVGTTPNDIVGRMLPPHTNELSVNVAYTIQGTSGPVTGEFTMTANLAYGGSFYYPAWSGLVGATMVSAEVNNSSNYDTEAQLQFFPAASAQH